MGDRVKRTKAAKLSGKWGPPLAECAQESVYSCLLYGVTPAWALELGFQAALLQHLDVGGRAVGRVCPDGAGDVASVKHSAELRAVIGGSVGGLHH